MSDKSLIEWTDATWNPITGCSIVSPGCTHCYAMKLAGGRLQHHPTRAGLTRQSKAGPVWTDEVRFNEKMLLEPLRWSRPRKIFVCAHGDLFAEGVPDEWIDKVFAVMALCPQHVFQVLTKRPERMRAYLRDIAGSYRERMMGVCDSVAELAAEGSSKVGGKHWANWYSQCQGDRPLEHVWPGVSAENEHWAQSRIPVLLDTPAAKRFVSLEPLLGPIELEPYVLPPSKWSNGWLNNYPLWFPKVQLDWVIVGGESGNGSRPMHPYWARSLRDQCATAGVPFFFKQHGAWAPVCALDDDTIDTLYSRRHVRDPEGTRRCLVPQLVMDADGTKHEIDSPLAFSGAGAMQMFLTGKGKAGRLLDGAEHNGMPA